MLCVTVVNGLAQDIIVKKDGTSIHAKVLDITPNDIKYKKWSNLEGPTYTVLASEIQKIIYKNGDVDNFNAKEEVNIKTLSNTVSSNNNPKANTIDFLKRDDLMKRGRVTSIWGTTLFVTGIIGVVTGGILIGSEVTGAGVGIMVPSLAVGVIGCVMMSKGNALKREAHCCPVKLRTDYYKV